MKLCMFRKVPLSIIRSFSLYTQQQYMLYRFADSFQAVSKHIWLIPLLCTVKTPDDGQRKCPKHVEFHSKNKFEKLVHLDGFTIRNLSRCTVTWTSNIRIATPENFTEHLVNLPPRKMYNGQPKVIFSFKTCKVSPGSTLGSKTVQWIAQIQIQPQKLWIEQLKFISGLKSQET